MWKFKKLQLPVYTGILLGVIFGTLDVFFKIAAKLSFQWFELYQSFIIHIGIFLALFLLIHLITELLHRIFKKKFNNRKIFYTSTALFLFLLAYGYLSYKNAFIQQNILSKIPFWDYLNTIYFELLAIFVMAFYILLLSNFKFLPDKIFALFNNKRTKNLVKNYIFFVMVFVLISLFLDVYTINHIPKVDVKDINGNLTNVVIISLDTLRADRLSLYNYSLNTSPHLKSLARKSTVFERAVSPSSWTLPAHSSIFTGFYPFNHGAISTHEFLSFNQTTLAEILKGKGYSTAGFVSGSYAKSKYGMSQGFDVYKDRIDFFEYKQVFDDFSLKSIINEYFLPLNQIIFQADGQRISYETNEDVFRWIKKNKDAPFFLFIHYFDSHDPYDLGKHHVDKFVTEKREYPDIASYDFKRYTTVNNSEVKHLSRLYDNEIHFLDNNLDKLLNMLININNTIIIVTSDHGEEFYEHGGFFHGFTLYEEVVHVPLIIYHPEKMEPQRINERVSTLNIFSTILDVLNISINHNVDGVSLMPLINGDTNVDMPFVYSQKFGREVLNQQDIKAAYYRDWKLIEVDPKNGTLPPSFFNLAEDKEEKVNLYNTNVSLRNDINKNIVGYFGTSK